MSVVATREMGEKKKGPMDPLLRKSESLVRVQDTIIIAWTIRLPARNCNDPIARTELYQLSYILPSQVRLA